MMDSYRSHNVGELIITDQLDRRTFRTADYRAEAEALTLLAEELAERPHNLLQKLTDTLVDLGISDSAGISLREKTDGAEQFRWVALSGQWSRFKGGIMPFDTSPSSVVIERDATLLIEHPQRFFSAAKIKPRVHEILLVPFHADGKPVGTLWITAHSQARKFNQEDVRLLNSLSRFASAGSQMREAVTEARAGQAGLERRVEERTKALRESEERLELLFKTLPIGVAIVDAHGTVLIANDEMRRYLPTGIIPSRDPANSGRWRSFRSDGSLVEPTDFPTAQALRGESIVPGLEMLYNENGGHEFWTRVASAPLYDGDGRIIGAASVVVDVDHLKRSEQALRESEERQRFMLKLSDALRPLADASEIQGEAARILGEQLGADRTCYAHMDNSRGIGFVEREYIDGDAPSIVGEHALAAYPAIVGTLHAGRAFVADDVKATPSIGPAELAALRSLALRSLVSIPLIKEGTLVASMSVLKATPHHWTEQEIRLAQETAERTWAAVERARAEDAARRKSAVLEGINRIFREALSTRSEEELGRICLAVAEDVTGSAFSFMGEINFATNTLDSVSISDRGWRHFTMDDPRFPQGKVPMGFKIHGIYGRVIISGKSLIANDPASHPDRIGTPKGHPPLQSFLGVPLSQSGKTVGMIGLGNRAGGFRQEDLEAAEALAPAILQALLNKRAESALRKSEERFQQFANASCEAIWIRNARTLAMEYASPALQTIYGVVPEAMLGDPKHWAALIVPDDRQAALANLENARRGEVVTHEFRVIRPSDGAFRWVRHTDFPVLDEQGSVQRIGGIAADVTEARQSAEHQQVLLAELQHRVRNIMAMIRSIASRTGERAESVPEYATQMAGRLLTLARVQALLTRAGNMGAGIATIVHDEMKAQAQHEGQYDMSGPDVLLSPKTTEVLTLAVHELATNALKYGALSVPTGRVSISWSTFEKRGAAWLSFSWIETTPKKLQPSLSRPHRRGFGSELIEGRIPYELGGRGAVTVGPRGAHCHLEFPLRDNPSILETGAPARATVFGGALDMTGEADLSGHRILVVEDDYYLATDTARAVQGAGAKVLGPCPTEEAARDRIVEEAPTGAVIDINLGTGPSFRLAQTLKESGIPLVFITGYDETVIPPEFANAPRLQKPVELRQIVNSLAQVFNSPSKS